MQSEMTLMKPKPMPGVLQAGVHDRLLADINGYAAAANIRKDWIWRTLSENLGQDEIAWAVGFRKHKRAGLVYTGMPKGMSVSDRMSALAGFLTRNFIAARVATLMEFLDAVDKGHGLEYSCLLVPNFHITAGDGGTLPAWRQGMLYDGLMHRRLQGQQTVLYVSSMSKLKADYGESVHDLLRQDYEVLGVK